MFKLDNLPYSYDALEPFIDSKTMEIHHTRHHQAYVDNLNKALENHTDLQRLRIEELVRDLMKVPEDVRMAVRNHGGGHLNHSLFWPVLKKGVTPGGEVLQELVKHFGSFDKFKETFSSAALRVFGSGWAWLVLGNNSLEIVTTQNQDNPITQGKIPVLGIDVWEHAYYLKYQNKRADYIKAFFNVIDWEQVEMNLVKAQKMLTHTRP